MGKRWYVVHVFSGFEKKMKQAILEQAINNSLDDMIEEVLVPTEEYFEMRRGAKVQAERKFFPGYILVKIVRQSSKSNAVRNDDNIASFSLFESLHCELLMSFKLNKNVAILTF